MLSMFLIKISKHQNLYLKFGNKIDVYTLLKSKVNLYNKILN